MAGLGAAGRGKARQGLARIRVGRSPLPFEKKINFVEVNYN